MDKETIKQELKTHHKNFISAIDSLSEGDFLFTPEGKWNAGQQLDHIYRSVAVLVLAMRIPKPAMKIIIGKANRPSRTYEGLIEKYQQKLSGGGKAQGKFIPSQITFQQKNKWLEKLYAVVEKLSTRIDDFSEEELEQYIMPHPLLGKLTLREMMFFTIYHVQHHQRLAIKNVDVS
ncbi:MAG: DinB family protein [Bacteroidetes bacterium]|nr:DinB family protein [Bacteroidota bacterium]